MTVTDQAASPIGWSNCRVTYYQGHRTPMTDFHSHRYYEVSLIISGSIKSLLCDVCEDSDRSRLVLTAPGTPHLMCMTAPSHYSRVNLCFSVDFITDCIPEWRALSGVFGRNGNIILLDCDSCEFFRKKLLAIDGEKNLFRKKLAILDFLSHVADIDTGENGSRLERPPRYVAEALTYIQEHFSERIVASELAWKLGISRTTLMTSFKKHTDVTLAEYITRVRVKKSIPFLRLGESQERVAELTGLGNSGGLIRAFRHCFGMTPGQYMKKLAEEERGE